MDTTPRPRKRRRLPLIVEILLALAAVALVQTFLVKPFGVPSQSMEQTLKIGDRIVVNRLDDTVNRGDIIVFSHGDTWQTSKRAPDSNLVKRIVRTFGDITGMGPSNTNYTVKRVIGLPGDKVSCCSPDGKCSSTDSPHRALSTRTSPSWRARARTPPTLTSLLRHDHRPGPQLSRPG